MCLQYTKPTTCVAARSASKTTETNSCGCIHEVVVKRSLCNAAIRRCMCAFGSCGRGVTNMALARSDRGLCSARPMPCRECHSKDQSEQLHVPPEETIVNLLAFEWDASHWEVLHEVPAANHDDVCIHRLLEKYDQGRTWTLRIEGDDVEAICHPQNNAGQPGFTPVKTKFSDVPFRIRDAIHSKRKEKEEPIRESIEFDEPSDDQYVALRRVRSSFKGGPQTPPRRYRLRHRNKFGHADSEAPTRRSKRLARGDVVVALGRTRDRWRDAATTVGGRYGTKQQPGATSTW